MKQRFENTHDESTFENTHDACVCFYTLSEVWQKMVNYVPAPAADCSPVIIDEDLLARCTYKRTSIASRFALTLDSAST
jgi:hypothetical protein